MQELAVIRLLDGAPVWCLPEGDLPLGDGEPRARLTAWVEERRGQLVFAAPGEDIVLRELIITAAERRYLGKSLPYLLEDELAAPIEGLHFASCPLARLRLGVAVCSHERMAAWARALDGLPPAARWVPEPLLLPWREGTLSMLVEPGRVLARTGPASGFCLERNLAQEVLEGLAEGLAAEGNIDRVPGGLADGPAAGGNIDRVLEGRAEQDGLAAGGNIDRVLAFGDRGDASLLPAPLGDKVEWRAGGFAAALSPPPEMGGNVQLDGAGQSHVQPGKPQLDATHQPDGSDQPHIQSGEPQLDATHQPDGSSQSRVQPGKPQPDATHQPDGSDQPHSRSPKGEPPPDTSPRSGERSPGATRHLDLRHLPNLLQGPYGANLPLGRWWRQWRLAAGLFLGAFCVQMAATWADHSRLEQQNLALRQQLESVYRQAAPRGSVPPDIERQLQRRLEALRGGAGNVSFLGLLERAGQVLRAAAGVRLTGVNFNDRAGVLRINIVAPDFKAVETVRANLAAAGLDAQTEGSSAGSGGVRARLTVGERRP